MAMRESVNLQLFRKHLVDKNCLSTKTSAKNCALEDLRLSADIYYIFVSVFKIDHKGPLQTNVLPLKGHLFFPLFILFFTLSQLFWK